MSERELNRIEVLAQIDDGQIERSKQRQHVGHHEVTDVSFVEDVPH